MIRAFRVLIGFSCLWLFFLAVQAQEKKDEQKTPLKKIEDEYRQFYKKPEKALEYWVALKFEIAVGKFELAAEDLKGLLAKNPTKDELLQMEEQDGISAFIKLLTIKELREDGKVLLDRVTQAVKEHRGDPVRIKHFIENLRGSPEEFAYALAELRKSGPLAVPHLIDAMRANPSPAEHAPILTALLQLGPNIVPPVLAALDINEPGLKAELIDLLYQRNDSSAVPYLWHISASPKEPEMVRTRASEVLVHLLRVKNADALPMAKVALTREAEKFYYHRVPFISAEAVDVWQWQNNKLISQTMTASRAEEYYGLRFAGQALDLDPAYEPAQVVFTSLAVEKGFERAGIDQPLEKGAPDVKELLRVVSPDLLIVTLERALSDHRIPVILGTARTLGDLGEVRALRPRTQREPGLLRALNYPDRRVQLAAADALLRIPNPEPYRISARIVEVLRRFCAADAKARVLVADGNKNRGDEVAKTVQTAGYDTEVLTTGADVLRRLSEAADVDALIINVDAGQKLLPQNPIPPSRPARAPQVIGPANATKYSLPDLGLPSFLAQLRADINFGLIPAIILIGQDQAGTTPAEFERDLRRLAESYRYVEIAPAKTDAEGLKKILQARITEAAVKPLSEAERKANAAIATLWLKRLAVGEVPGYDIRPAEKAILNALHSPELAPLAIEAAGKLPGANAQRELAKVVLDSSQLPQIRSAAALELAHHIESHSLVLTQEIKNIDELYATAEDAKLKSNLALVLGSMHPDAKLSGTRLQGYKPASPAPVKEK